MRLILACAITGLVLAGCGCTAGVAPPQDTADCRSHHSVPAAELDDASTYWNLDWKGRAGELYHDIRAVVSGYSRTHRFAAGDTDCNDMAVDLWDRFLGRGIVSIVVVGNLEMTRERLGDCNHAWLMVYSGEGAAAAVETTSGRTYTWQDTQADQGLRQYWEGFVYDSPSDLRADFEERW